MLSADTYTRSCPKYLPELKISIVMSKLLQIISALGDPVFVIDHRGYFTESYNEENMPLLKPKAEFLNKHHRETLPPAISELLEDAIALVSAGETDGLCFDYELEIDGRRRWFSCTISSPSDSDRGCCFYAVIRERTDWYEQRSSVNQKEMALSASAFANEALLRNRNIVHAASLGLRELGLAMKADRCYMFRISWSETLQENVSSQLLEWTNDFAEPQINNPELQDVPFSLVHPFMDELLENKPFICLVEALPPESGLRQILSMQSILSLVALPIWVNGALWGFVGFDDCQRKREWDRTDVSILASFATSIASAILRGKIEDDLQSAKIEAETANQAKSIFLSNITHEIRTPLHGVIGYTEMLSGYPFPQQEDEYFNNLKLSASTLYELINNILDISKIEAGVFEMAPENFLLADIIKSTIASVSFLLKSSGNTLVTNINETELPEIIYVDATRLKQVLVNFLSNAMKFSSESVVELSIKPDVDSLRFSIRDHGIGISAEQLQLLFTPFKQFDSSFSKRYQGSGLGLSITRHILSMMGCVPEVESELGKGATFSFALPLQSIRAVENKQDAPAQPRPDLAQVEMDVMIVEDNRLNMLLMETVLRDIAPRIHVHKAANGMEAIQRIENGLAPELVFMDLQMPIMDGFETTKVIRELLRSPMRIVALTASAISEVRDRCLSSGMDDFLTKPFTRDQISQLLEQQISGS